MSSAFRLEIDSLADDQQMVRTTSFGFGLLSIFILPVTGMYAIGSILQLWQNDLLHIVSSVLLFTVAIIVSVAVWALRRGFGLLALMHRIVTGLIFFFLVMALGHITMVWLDPVRWAVKDSDKIGTVACGYGAVIALFIALAVACSKAERLSKFDGDGVLYHTINLINPKKGLRSARRTFVLPPLRRLPMAVLWASIAAVLKIIGASIAGMLGLVTFALSYLIPMPQLLQLLGPKLSRPIFETGEKAAHMSRRYLTVSASQKLEADGRPPILFLRSFVDDNLQIKESDSEEWVGRNGLTFEEILTKVLSQFGPVVAIGRPNETVPCAGASREYHEDDTWQGRVEELAREASVIVMIAGKTMGLAWELGHIESLGATDKLLIVVPSNTKAEAADRLLALSESLSGTKMSAAIFNNLHTDAAVVSFRRENIFEIASSRRLQRDYETAITIGVCSIFAQDTVCQS